MSCVEKRHMSHRVGSMLHHRFPNGFTDLFMDETDREVSTLTDRAFRSLCVGDDAVYNDEFLCGYSPFSCHKPLVGEPLKKTHHKESKKHGQSKNDKNNAQPWKQQQRKDISHMSSFLKALSATEESCEGMLIKNGGMTDSNGESWDKSALRSIQRELSEFSSDYHTNLTDGHYKNHHRNRSGDGSSHKSGKNGALPSGKSSKIKNGKSTVKLRKLNIKNFFLHSEFSPFQTWRDFNRFPFGQEETTILPTDNIPKWYDLPFYKELTEAHRKETLHTEEAQSCPKTAVEPPPIAPKPIPPPPPPKVLPKPSATPAEKRCSSNVGDGTAAPWRRNKSRARSAIPVNQPGIPSQDNNSKTVEESLLLAKKEARSVEVKAIEEVSSLASTPFSICQLMTPLIPSRQPTETSEILQAVLSPSALDLPLMPHSEAKVTPEPPVKRESYKSLASSILFNLKDNRKRVKSRYSPPKFKTLELPESGIQSPQSDHLKHPQAGSEGNASGLSTPAILKDGQSVCTPILEPADTPTVDLTKHDTETPLSDDYLLSNLLHTKKNKSPLAKKQNYPSLNLYKKASPVDGDRKYLQVPLSSGAHANIDQPAETNELSPPILSKELSPKALPTNTDFLPHTLNVNKDVPSIISPQGSENHRLSSNGVEGKRPLNVLDKAKQLVNDTKEKDIGVQSASKEIDVSGQTITTMEVIRAAREAINAAKHKALSAAAHSGSINKPLSDIEEMKEKEIDESISYSKEAFNSKKERSVSENNVSPQNRNESASAALAGKKSNVKKDPPPVPKRSFAKSDIEFSLALDKQQTNIFDKPTNGDLGDAKLDLPPKENESVSKQGKSKHIFSARQNNYIKHQRYAVMEEEQVEKCDKGDLNVNPRMETDEEMMPLREGGDSEHIINDLHALKEIERARLGDRILESAKNKLGVTDIDEEAKAKNDLISRELRNIKKGMLSMRGNTLAKRELFAKKDEEHRKQEAVTKVDSNVMVNKALINDNYDKAKMALEEIISERQKRRNIVIEEDANANNENAYEESSIAKAQQSKKAMKDSLVEGKEKHNSSTFKLKEKELKQRLGDLTDHNHMRQILSQTEPGRGDTHRLSGRIALPGMDEYGNDLDVPHKTKTKHVNDNLTFNPNYESEEVNFRHVARQVSEDNRENLISEIESNKSDAPPVPPRIKKGGSKRDGSITKEIDSLRPVDEDVFNIDWEYENGEVCLNEQRGTSLGKQEVDSERFKKEAVPIQSETTSEKELWDVVNNANSKSITVADPDTCEPILPSNYPHSEHSLHLSPEIKRDENEGNKLQTELSNKREATVENSNPKAQETRKIKRKAPLKPDHLITPDDNVTKTLIAEDEPGKINRPAVEINVDTEAPSEMPRNIISPLLLVNGVSINQSPPDQASLSSKSSYFSVESALHRNTETESNVYHSLENLIGEVEEVDEEVRNVSRNTKQDSDRTEVDYFSLSDHESEPEAVKRPITVPQKETEVRNDESKDKENMTKDQSLTHGEKNPMSPSNTFSPPHGIPALFKVKDNTFSTKLKKTLQPWTPRGSLSGLEKVEEQLHQVKENPEPPRATETLTIDSTIIPSEIIKSKEILPKQSPPLLLSPSNLQSENPKKAQDGQFLTVPQEDDRFSGVSPSSEGMESLTTSTADTADETGVSAGVPAEHYVSKVPSECSGSTCSGNESQTGLPKPPAVLPKSEKAVLKAIKLANRRMKKEEAQKSSHKSSQSSSKHRADRNRGDKSEQKSSSSSKNNKSSDKKNREKMDDGHHQSENSHGKTSNDRSEQRLHDRRGHNSENPHERTELNHNTRRQSHESVDSNNQSKKTLPSVATERQGRSSNRHIRDKSDKRHYSIDRVISNVPVYKAHVSERPMSDRPFQRSQSIDRYIVDKAERRLSADMSGNEKFDPRTQRIEKSIMDELQQRGRARGKTSRDNSLRRSHSIDAYSAEVPHPATLSCQSIHTSQPSRQSSIEHAIVAQSFPMTQRKLLQDPDSGQYFFVDMPVQVKTKTFFDPATGSYVQLPIQPTEGALPQASPMEVLTPPLVVYHGFVPVPLSPMAQKATVQPPHTEHDEFEQRHLERSRQMHCQEGHPYLEPVYGQQDHMLGEFMGTEELDCPS